jgi:hypothetical protein
MPRLESGCTLVDVTSISRPDPAWRYTDPAGHLHRWLVGPDGLASDHYHPSAHYHVPTAVRVWDGSDAFTTDDGDTLDPGHLACRLCGARVAPGTCADTHQQLAPGLRWYRVDGRLVSRDEFVAAGGRA